MFLVLVFGLLSIHRAFANPQDLPYLPLEPGKKWVLHSDAWQMDFSFEVVEFKEGAYLVRLNNPWMPWEMTLFPVKDKVYLQSQRIGGHGGFLNGYSLYYDFNSAAATTIPVAMGTLKVISKSKTVTTDKATYNNCISLELTAPDGFRQTWAFAPGVGFVEYVFAGTTFILNEAASALDVPSANDIPAWESPVEKADRVLGIDISTAENNSYQMAFDKALAVGAQAVSLHFDWSALETVPNNYDFISLDIADQYYSYYDKAIILALAPIHNVTNQLPADLQGLPLDDPQVVRRFNQMMEGVLARLTNVKLAALIIGNEVDAYLGADPVKWNQYVNFYRQVTAYAHQLRPALKVAAEFRFIQGYQSAARPFLDTLNQYSDVIAVSYYPTTLEASVLDPEVVTRHFKTLAEAFPEQPIYFTQLGYPSSPDLQSSEAMQATFVQQVFKAWDRYSGQVKCITFGFLHDFNGSDTMAAFATYFGDSSPAFRAFLSSLGLRSAIGDGVDKPAFTTLGWESSARGW